MTRSNESLAAAMRPLQNIAAAEHHDAAINDRQTWSPLFKSCDLLGSLCVTFIYMRDSSFSPLPNAHSLLLPRKNTSLEKIGSIELK